MFETGGLGTGRGQGDGRLWVGQWFSFPQFYVTKISLNLTQSVT